MDKLNTLDTTIQNADNITKEHGQEIISTVRNLTDKEGPYLKVLSSMKAILFDPQSKEKSTQALEERVKTIDKNDIDAYLSNPDTPPASMNGDDIGCLACLHYISVPGSHGRKDEMKDPRFKKNIDELFTKKQDTGGELTTVDKEILVIDDPIESMTTQEVVRLQEYITGSEDEKVKISYGNLSEGFQPIIIVSDENSDTVGEVTDEGITINIGALSQTVHELNTRYSTNVSTEDYFNIVLAAENINLEANVNNGTYGEVSPFQAALSKEKELYPNSEYPITKMLLVDAIEAGGSNLSNEKLISEYNKLANLDEITQPLSRSEGLELVNTLDKTQLESIRQGFIDDVDDDTPAQQESLATVEKKQVNLMTTDVITELQSLITPDKKSVEIIYIDQPVTIVNDPSNDFVGETTEDGITIDLGNLTKNVSDINKYFTDTNVNVEDYFEIVLANENADFKAISGNGEISEKSSFQAGLVKEQKLFPDSAFPETKLLLTEAMMSGGSDADGGTEYGMTYKLILEQYNSLDGVDDIVTDGGISQTDALEYVNSLTPDKLKSIRSGFIDEEVGGGVAGNRKTSSLSEDADAPIDEPEELPGTESVENKTTSIDLPVLSFMPGLAGNPKITGMLRGHFDTMETKMDALSEQFKEHESEFEGLLANQDKSDPIGSLKNIGKAMLNSDESELNELGEVFHKMILETIKILQDTTHAIETDIAAMTNDTNSDLDSDQKDSLKSIQPLLETLEEVFCTIDDAIDTKSEFTGLMKLMVSNPTDISSYFLDNQSAVETSYERSFVPSRKFLDFRSNVATSFDLNNSQALNYISDTETAQGMVDQLGQLTDTHTVAEINGESIYFNNAYLEESGYGKETNGKMEVNTDKYSQLLLADMETSKEGIGISVNELVNAIYKNTNTTILLKDDMRDASDPDQLDYIDRIHESDMEGKIDGFTEGVKEDDLDGAGLLTGTTPSEIQEKREGLLSRKVDYTIVGSVLSPKITTLQPIVKVLHDGKKIYMHAKDFTKTMKKYDDTMKGGEKRRQLRNDKVENERLQINYTKYIGQKFGIDKKYDIQPKVKGETFSNILELTDNDGGVLEIHVNLPNTIVSIPGVNKDFNGCSFELTKETGNETIDRSLKLQKEYKSLNARWTKLRHEGAQLPAELTDKIVFLEKNDRSLVTGEWSYVGVDRAEFEGKRVPDGFSILDMKA